MVEGTSSCSYSSCEACCEGIGRRLNDLTLVVLGQRVDDGLSLFETEFLVVFSDLLEVIAAEIVGFADGCGVVSRG